jgi:hypothetical protein
MYMYKRTGVKTPEHFYTAGKNPISFWKFPQTYLSGTTQVLKNTCAFIIP